MAYESQVHGPRDINNYNNRGHQRVKRDITPPIHGLFRVFFDTVKAVVLILFLDIHHTSEDYLWLWFTKLIFMRFYIHQEREPPKQAVCTLNTGSV